MSELPAPLSPAETEQSSLRQENAQRIDALSLRHVDWMQQRLALPMPDGEKTIEFLGRLKELLFPLTANHGNLSEGSRFEIGYLFELITSQVSIAFVHSPAFHALPEATRKSEAERLCSEIFSGFESIREILESDILAAMNGDPAARSPEDILFSYPGFSAILTFRIAHEFQKKGVPLIPRFMTEYAHRHTGIDIHPGATIGAGFFIDHGTGVVIGETAEIGKNVRLYQGVTLGAGTDPVRAGRTKRHPTLQDGVVCFANSGVFGPVTIGENARIGAGAEIFEDIPRDTKVSAPRPELLKR